MTSTKPNSFVRVSGRSFMAIVLAPESPVDDWLIRLDEQTRRAPLFFEERPVVLDLSALPPETDIRK